MMRNEIRCLVLSVLLISTFAHAGENVREVLSELRTRESADFETMTLREFAPWLEKEVEKIDPAGKGVVVRFRKKGPYRVPQELLDRKLGFKIGNGVNLLELLRLVGSVTATRFVQADSRTLEVIVAID